MSSVLPLRTTLVGRGAAGIREIVGGPARPARVVGRFVTALYLQVERDDQVVALVSRDGIALPNAIRLPVLGAALDLVRWRGPFVVGDGRVRGADVTVVPDTWFGTRPALPHVQPQTVQNGLQQLEDALRTGPEAHLDGLAPGELADALRQRDPRRSRAAVRSLVGLGAGLTPTGDDVVAGAVAAGLAGARQVDDPATVTFFERVGADAAAVARGRTTALSATLLRHAARGEMATPARRLVEALFGDGRLLPALDALLRVGHTSGRDLAVGIVAGTRAVFHDRDRRSHE